MHNYIYATDTHVNRDPDHRDVARVKSVDVFEHLHHRCWSLVRLLCFHRLRNAEIIGKDGDSVRRRRSVLAASVDSVPYRHQLSCIAYTLFESRQLQDYSVADLRNHECCCGRVFVFAPVRVHAGVVSVPVAPEKASSGLSGDTIRSCGRWTLSTTGRSGAFIPTRRRILEHRGLTLLIFRDEEFLGALK